MPAVERPEPAEPRARGPMSFSFVAASTFEGFGLEGAPVVGLSGRLVLPLLGNLAQSDVDLRERGVVAVGLVRFRELLERRHGWGSAVRIGSR